MSRPALGFERANRHLTYGMDELYLKSSLLDSPIYSQAFHRVCQCRSNGLVSYCPDAGKVNLPGNSLKRQSIAQRLKRKKP
jgi:hypothetical protein